MIKRKILVCVLVILCLLGLLVAAESENVVCETGYCGTLENGADGTNLIYTLYEDGTCVISGTGAMRSFDDERSPWMNSNKGRLRMIVEEGVTTIGSDAFYGSIGEAFVAELTIPTTIENIFADPYKLEKVLVSDINSWYNAEGISLLKSGNAKLYLNGEEVTHLDVPAGVTEIPSYFLYNSSAFTAVSLPDTVHTIGDSAFCGCERLVQVNLGNGLNKIGEFAFQSCSALKEIALPQSLMEMEWGVFNKCTSLESIVIPPRVTEVPELAFSDCSTLRRVELPQTLRRIGMYAFEGTSLENVIVPENVISIGYSAFGDCVSLKNVSLPKGLMSLGKNTFENCEKLETVTLPEMLVTIGSGVFANCTSLRSVTLSDSVIYVPNGMFRNCTALENVHLGQSVAQIESNAFYGCTSLSSITLPKALYRLNNYAFANCTALKTVTFEGAAPMIEDSAFYRIEADVYYSANSESWSQEKLVDYRGTLNWIPFDGTAEAEVVIGGVCGTQANWCFEPATGALTISGRGDVYSYLPWESFMTSICSVVVENGITGLPEKVFNGANKLEWITLPDSLQTIGDNAFGGCKTLTSLRLPASMHKLSAYLLSSCESLTSVTLPRNLRELGTGAFYNCKMLQSISLPDTLQVVGENSFSGSGLVSVTLPDSVHTIGSQAFKDCASLKTLVLPNGIQELPSNMTANITFEKITIPASVIKIGDGAIRYIQEITFLGAAPEMTETFRSDCPPLPDVNPTAARSLADVYSVFYPTIRYPEGDASWNRYINDENLYNVTWVPYTPERPLTPIAECEVELESYEYSYDGQAKFPAVTVMHDGSLLSSQKDYSLVYENNINAGNASVMISGLGVYTGSVTHSFTIAPLDSILTFQNDSLTKEADAAPFINPLTIVSDGSAFFTSSNENVATVDSLSGRVTIVGEGNATIVASCVNVVNYRGAQASYSLTVLPKEEPVGLPTFAEIAYSFSNYGPSFGYGDGYRIPLERYQMFFPDILAQYYYNTRGIWGGSCFGMSTTSGMLSAEGSVLELADYGVDSIRSIKVSTAGPYGLNAREIIEAGQVSWWAGNISSNYTYYKNDLNRICHAVENSKITGEPVVMCIYGAEGGHAVVAIGLEQVSSTEARMYVYDCNYPSDSGRYIRLTKDSEGNYTKWYYLLNNRYKWGTGYSENMITCISYDTYNAIWQNVKTTRNVNLLSISSDNFEVYDYTGTRVAEMIDGRFTSYSRSVYIMVEPRIGSGSNYSICLPTAYYEVITTDGSPLCAVMINNAQSAAVETSASAVGFAVSDEDECNIASIFVNEGENYTVNMRSELDSAQEMEELIFTGVGEGEMIAVGLEGGELVMNGCPSASLWINGVKVSSAEEDAQCDIQTCEISLAYTAVGYTGAALEPKVTVSNGALVLMENVDYEVAYADNTEIGTATVGVYGIGAYSGQAFVTFEIMDSETACINGHFWDNGVYVPNEHDLNGIIHYTCTVCGECNQEAVLGYTYEITSLTGNYVDLRLTNRTNDYISGLMCVTVLDSDGMPLAIGVQEVKIGRNESCSMLMDFEGSAKLVKAFVVDAETLIPLGSVWQNEL